MNRPVYGAALVRHLETLEPRIVMTVTTYTDTVDVIDEDGNADTYTATIAYDTDAQSSWESHFSSYLTSLGNHASTVESEGINLQSNPGDNLQTPTITSLEALGGTSTTNGILQDFFGPLAAQSNYLKTTYSLTATTFNEFAAYTGNPPDNPTGVSSNAEAAARVQEIGGRLQVIGARMNEIKDSMAGSSYLVQLLKGVYYIDETIALRNEVRALTKELKWIDVNYPNR